MENADKNDNRARLRVEMVSVDELKPYENNPRKNDNSVPVVAKSIRDFGFLVPILVDNDNNVIAGHTRLNAAISLGIVKVPVIKNADLDSEEVSALRLADNKCAEYSRWDYRKLSDEINSIYPYMSLDGYFLDEVMSSKEIVEEHKKFNCPKCGSVLFVEDGTVKEDGK